MSDDTKSATPRRSFFARLAGVLAPGLAGLLPAAAHAAGFPGDGPNWPGAVSVRHRLVVDAIAVNTAQLDYAANFIGTATPPGSARVAIVFRGGALPMALEDAIWAKYRIGENLGIIDPETRLPAVKHPFLRPKEGVLPHSARGIAHLVELGAIIGACDVALRGTSRDLSVKIGVAADEAAREWAANLIPGATLLPSGVWGIGRAQDAGFGYCAGGS